MIYIGTPTFNRKKDIVYLLEEFNKNSDSKICWIIRDNASPYKLKKKILSSQFKNQIFFKRNKTNIGILQNIYQIIVDFTEIGNDDDALVFLSDDDSFTSDGWHFLKSSRKIEHDAFLLQGEQVIHKNAEKIGYCYNKKLLSKASKEVLCDRARLLSGIVLSYKLCIKILRIFDDCPKLINAWYPMQIYLILSSNIQLLLDKTYFKHVVNNTTYWDENKAVLSIRDERILTYKILQNYFQNINDKNREIICSKMLKRFKIRRFLLMSFAKFKIIKLIIWRYL